MVVWESGVGLKVVQEYGLDDDGLDWTVGLVISMATADTMEHSYPLLCWESVSESSDTWLSPDDKKHHNCDLGAGRKINVKTFSQCSCRLT